MTTLIECSEKVYDSYVYPGRQCQKPVVKGKDGQPILEDGRPWCRQHLPSNIAAKRKAAEARDEAEGTRLEEARRRRKAEERACKDVSTEALEQGYFEITITSPWFVLQPAPHPPLFLGKKEHNDK